MTGVNSGAETAYPSHVIIEPYLKIGAPEGKAVSAPLLTPVMLFSNPTLKLVPQKGKQFLLHY
jgi:hypothetical protein